MSVDSLSFETKRARRESVDLSWKYVPKEAQVIQCPEVDFSESSCSSGENEVCRSPLLEHKPL